MMSFLRYPLKLFKKHKKYLQAQTLTPTLTITTQGGPGAAGFAGKTGLAGEQGEAGSPGNKGDKGNSGATVS